MQRIKRSILAGTVCGAIVLLSIISGGCALGTSRLDISHEPLSPVVQKRQGDILVRQFADKRVQTEYIGNKRNGLGLVLGHFATQEGVKLDELLTKYFIEALQDAGYNAVLYKSAPGGLETQLKCDAIIDGEIVEFWTDLYLMVWHSVGVKVKAIKPVDQKVVWEKLIQGSESRVLWAGATGEFESTINEAVTKALNRAAQDFASDDFYNSAIINKGTK